MKRTIASLLAFFASVGLVLTLAASSSTLSGCSSSSGGGSASSDGGSDAGSKGKTCGQLVKCDQACGGAGACTDQCYQESTKNAQTLFTEFNDCLNTACPTAGGGPCVDVNSSACSTCNQNAATGACVTNLVSCLNDPVMGPPNGDAGIGPIDAGNGELACGALVACVSNCPTNPAAYAQCSSACKFTATPQAIQLDGLLNDCLDMACPTTDGGVCATPGVSCAGCQEQAVFAMPNICAVPWTNCQNDRVSGDGGTAKPTPLQDGGVLSTVATGLVQAASTLVVQNGDLYFTQVDGNGRVSRLTLGAGGPIDVADAGGALTLFGPSTQTPCGLALDSNNVYVWSYGTFSGMTSFNNGDGTVTQVPLDGGAATTLEKNFEDLYDAPYLTSVTSDGTNVYWVKGAKGTDGVIMKTAVGNPNSAPLYTTQEIPEAIATDGTNVYWADWGTFDSTGASNNDATVWQGSVNGGTPIMLASNQMAPAVVVVDSKNVYWTNLGKLGASLFPATNSGSVVQVPIGGGTVVTVAASEPIPISLVVSGGQIYWTRYGLSVPGEIVMAPVGGGAITPLVGGLNDPFSLAMSGSTLYWTNTPSSNGGGTILSYKLP
ncbi:MAG TPA: hypothetical protein VMI75_28205 [Polyangiaceae bacterium]|nr:hypothetical protein [Polyangiaceae bacterium]